MEYIPDRHRVHSMELLAPVPVWYVPGWQGRQVPGREAPTVVEYVPTRQRVQLVMVVTPVPVEYVPD